MSINAEQIRAARAILKWTQGELAQRAKVNINSIKNIEAEITQPRQRMLTAIQQVFEMAGLEFLAHSGVRLATDIIRTIQGGKPYVTIFHDAFETLKNTGGLVYISGAEHRRSPPEVNYYKRLFRRHNIQMKLLVEHGNTYLTARVDEYRWMPKETMSNDVIIFYAGKVCFTLNKSDWPNHVYDKTLIITNQVLYEDYQKKFEFMWNVLPQPPYSTAPDEERV